MVDAMNPDALRKEAMEAKACAIAGADRVEVIYPNKAGPSVIATFFYGREEIEASYPTQHVGAQDALLLAAAEARDEAGKAAKPIPEGAEHSEGKPDPDEQPAKKTVVEDHTPAKRGRPAKGKAD